jgi:hypothetical protein
MVTWCETSGSGGDCGEGPTAAADVQRNKDGLSDPVSSKCLALSQSPYTIFSE